MTNAITSIFTACEAKIKLYIEMNHLECKQLNRNIPFVVFPTTTASSFLVFTFCLLPCESTRSKAFCTSNLLSSTACTIVCSGTDSAKTSLIWSRHELRRAKRDILLLQATQKTVLSGLTTSTAHLINKNRRKIS